MNSPLQQSLGKMSIDEISLVQALRKNDKEEWFIYGKSLEISLSISNSTARPLLHGNQARILSYMYAIRKYKESNTITKDLITLIKMKKSKYREALIEYGIWTEELYCSIRNDVLNIKEMH